MFKQKNIKIKREHSVKILYVIGLILAFASFIPFSYVFLCIRNIEFEMLLVIVMILYGLVMLITYFIKNLLADDLLYDYISDINIKNSCIEVIYRHGSRIKNVKKIHIKDIKSLNIHSNIKTMSLGEYYHSSKYQRESNARIGICSSELTFNLTNNKSETYKLSYTSSDTKSFDYILEIIKTFSPIFETNYEFSGNDAYILNYINSYLKFGKKLIKKKPDFWSSILICLLVILFAFIIYIFLVLR